MSGQFKVGEVLVGQKLVRSAFLNGMECIVLCGLDIRPGISRETGEYVAPSAGHEVRWANGMVMHVAPENLRRKQPPAGEQSVMDMFKLPAPRVAETA